METSTQRIRDFWRAIFEEVKRKPYVHRLVVEAFIPNPLGLPQVDHINEIKTDNRAVNLRWCTQEQNLAWYADNHYKGPGAG